MTTLQLDIKSNNALEKSALATADALSKVADYEDRIDASANKIAASYGRVSKSADAVSAASANQTKVQTNAYGELGKKQDKASDKDKKQKTWLDKLSDSWKKIQKAGDKAHGKIKDFNSTLIHGLAKGFAVATAGALALGVAVALSAKHAFDARKESLSLMGAFTGGRGVEVMGKLDAMAGKLGMSLSEARAKFIEFRKAGLNNNQSAGLIKLRADLMATGLSAKAADDEISSVTSAADGIGNIGAQRAMKELERAYKVTGSGAKAASLAMISLEGAEAKIGNAASETLAGIWKDIGPSIGKAAHELADFAVEFLKSAEGKGVIKEISDAVKDLFKTFIENKGAIKDIFKDIRDTALLATSAIKGLTKVMGFLHGEESVAEKASSGDELKKQIEAGKNLAEGAVAGMKGGLATAGHGAKVLAEKISGSFANALGIHSPSKVFADYGKNTVAGYEQGQTKAIASTPMPLQEAAAVMPSAPAQSSERKPQGSPMMGAGLTVNVTVEGNGSQELGDAIGVAVRRQMQLLLQAGSLSAGGA